MITLPDKNLFRISEAANREGIVLKDYQIKTTGQELRA